MQRPDQIERILSRLKEVWERNPDLSFYELIHNISLTDPNVKELLVHIRMDGIESGPELYVTSQKSVGDRAFEQRLETYIRMYHPELLPKPNNSTLERTLLIVSTQGCVAFGTLQSWRGVYNNNSSYPTGLGPLVWEQIKKYGPKGLVEELRRLTDWRDIYTDGVCPYCGKRQGFPKDISALIAYDWSYNWALDCTSLDDVRHLTLNRKLSPTKDLGNMPLVKIANLSRLLDDVNREAEHVWTVIQNIRQTRYPDPDAKFHAHFEAGENHITHATVNPFYIEYVYIIDVEANRLHILYQHVITPNNPGWEEAEKEALSSPDVNEFDYPGGFVNVEGFFEFNGKHAYYQKHPSIISWHEVLASIDLDGDEPDWDQLEEMAHLLAKKPEVVRAN